MEEDRHLDGRAVVGAGCAAASFLALLFSVPVSILFGAFGLILAGASVIAVDEGEPASPRTRRLALIAGIVSAVLVAGALALLLTGPESQ